MPAVLDFTEKQALIALRTVLLGMVPPGVEVIRAQVNRVPEPLGPDFVIYTLLRRHRLSTNVDTDIDTAITGAITAGTMNVTALTADSVLLPGYGVTGPAVQPDSYIVAQIDGTPGGIGDYTVTPTQTALGPLYAGTHGMLQPVNLVLQLDIHGPASGDTIQSVSTFARDEAGTIALDDLGLNLQTLYTTDPTQATFINAESQFEDRWVCEWHVQCNFTLTVLQQFADQVVVDVKLPVDSPSYGAAAD